MANIPQKTLDPTEEALVAIQEALSTNSPERIATAPAASPDLSRRWLAPSRARVR